MTFSDCRTTEETSEVIEAPRFQRHLLAGALGYMRWKAFAPRYARGKLQHVELPPDVEAALAAIMDGP